jgi:hypothetical protein
MKLTAQSGGKFYRFSCRDDIWILVADLHGAWRVMGLVSGDDAEDIINPLPVWTPSNSRST